MKSILAAAFAIWAIGVLPVFGQWTTYLGNNQRTGYVSQKVQLPLQPTWTYRAAAKPEMAWSGPRSTPIEGHEMRHRVNFDDALQVVIQAGRAYFGSTVDNNLYCVDALTGAEIWRFRTDGPIRLAPTLAHGNVYFGSDDGVVYCIAQSTAEPVWQRRVAAEDDRLLSRGEMISRWPVRTGVLVDGDIAYFGAGVFPHERVYLCAANARDGSIVWQNDTISEQNAGRNDLSPQGYLLSNDRSLFFPSGRSLPVAVDRDTGKIQFQRQHSWRTDAGGVVGGTKSLLGDGQIYAGGPHHFLAMDDQTGDVGESWINGRQMVLSGAKAYLMDGERIFCVDRAEHARASQEKQKWFLKARQFRSEPEKVKEAKEMMEKYTRVGTIWEHASAADDALIACDNLVFAGGQDEVIALDTESGELAWKAAVEGNVRGLALSEEVLTVSTDIGHIYAFSTIAGNGPAQSWPASYQAAYAEDDLSDFYRNSAAEILDQSGQTKGFCLVVGSEKGRLAYELASQSDLTVLGVEPNADKAKAARYALEAAGVHGRSVTIVNAPLDALPFSNYFANLIVSDTQLLTGNLVGQPEQISRHLKPCGGVVMLSRKTSKHANSPETSPEGEATPQGDTAHPDPVAWLTQFFQQNEGELSIDGPWCLLTRGKLPGAGAWTHQYGNVANTSLSQDERIRDGLGVLWYGDPGPSAMINRHEAAGAPLSTNGRMFIQGTESVMAYDAYNGTFLWEYANPGAIRTGVFNNRETHNLAASDDALFVAVGPTCSVLDATSGEVLATHQTPETADGVPRDWAYLAHDDGQLFGTSTIRSELEERMRRRGLTVKSQTDALFAVDAQTGQQLWIHRGKNILHTTIAIGPERVYFIDSSITPEQRQLLYARDKAELRLLTGDAAKRAEEEAKRLDLRLAVALDRQSGEVIWQKPVNVTDTTNVSAGGGSLTLMYADGHVVLCGANANGHYWKQFLAGEFDRRKLSVLDASNGEELWSRNANYMNRPAVVGQEIYAEPWAFDLHSGEPKKSAHPLTGQEVQWRFSRPGHHCGIVTATPNMMFFRSGFIGYYDIYKDAGTRHFAGQRLGCWVNAIPGNGLVMIPEASAGCVCQFSIASTVVMEPKSVSNSWGIFSAVGPQTPVQRIGINLGAPGDRKDSVGKEWFGYPRPASRGRLEFVFDVKPQLASGGGWYHRNLESFEVSDDEKPWLYTSGVRGLERCQIPLLGAEDPPATYTVRLFLAGVERSFDGPFSIRLQGKPVKSEIIVRRASGGRIEPQVLEFTGIEVQRDLVVELQHSNLESLGSVAAIEVIRQ